MSIWWSLPLKAEQNLPEFQLPDQKSVFQNLETFKGQWKVVYFYPKDNTPGCSTEAVEFSNLVDEFASLESVIYGVSPDSVDSHCKFVEKKNLRINLLSDENHQFTEACGFWQLKKFMGREFMGVIRSTLLIDESNQIRFVWTPVKVKDHAANVLAKLKELKGA